MPTVSHIFFISALLCVVLLLVLGSLLRSGIAGVREWFAANAVAGVAFILYAMGKDLPPLIAYEVANGVYAIATAALVAGFRRFFGQEICWKELAVVIILLVVAVALFRYIFDSFALRTVSVSIFQVVFHLAIALSIVKSPIWRTRYPYIFTISFAGLVAVGNASRAIIHVISRTEVTSLLQPALWNLVFLSLGAMVLPVLTLGAVMMVHDRMMVRAEDAANRDFLTGAWSRRAFFQLGERELAQVARTKTHLSLLVLDVDYFKTINDTLGHAAGDKVLIDVVQRALRTMRKTDYFARIGGEEFAALLPSTDLETALSIAERLRAALEQPREAIDSIDRGNSARYTVSLGVAELQNAESFPQLLNRADMALYSAKESGRNLVVASTGNRVSANRPSPWKSFSQPKPRRRE